jgi:hypothetical protein
VKKLYLPIIMIIATLVVAGVYYAIKTWKPASEIPQEQSVVEDIITRKQIMTDVSKKIAKISPVKPVLGGKWRVNRLWFVQGSNENFYVEYEDGHILRRVLIMVKKKDDGLDYKVIAYFEPGEVDWELKDGEDKFFGSSLDLYEYNDELGKWIKKN